MTIGLIWAQSTSGVIGRGGAIPWSLPEDLARFKSLTMGHTVVMGRRNVVLTRNPSYRADGADVVTSIEDSLTDPDTWVIGGAEIYHLAMPWATRCEVTEVDLDLHLRDEDVLAPMLDESWVGTAGDWQDSTSGLRYRFYRYLRP